jgi:hypothetical protein
LPKLTGPSTGKEIGGTEPSGPSPDDSGDPASHIGSTGGAVVVVVVARVVVVVVEVVVVAVESGDAVIVVVGDGAVRPGPRVVEVDPGDSVVTGDEVVGDEIELAGGSVAGVVVVVVDVVVVDVVVVVVEVVVVGGEVVAVLDDVLPTSGGGLPNATDVVAATIITVTPAASSVGMR